MQKKTAKQKKPLNLILLGDPAAGKATQAAFLVKKYHMHDFDMGQELRNRKRRDKKFNKQLKNSYDAGKLTQTAIVRKILRQTIISTPQRRGILFDGHPKMLGEAKIAHKLLRQHRRRDPVVLYLSIPLEETVRRMQGRKDYFRGKFSKRTDDTSAALRNRVKYYRKNIAQVVKFFKSKYYFKKINGLGSVSEIRQRLARAIEAKD